MTKEEIEKWIEDYDKIVELITAATGEKMMMDMWGNNGKVFARFLSGKGTGTLNLSWTPEELLAQQIKE